MTDFDGDTYDARMDRQRLATALERVYAVMSMGQWVTLKELAIAAHCSEAGASARLRDLRKSKWRIKYPNDGIEAARRGGGLWAYRMRAKVAK